MMTAIEKLKKYLLGRGWSCEGFSKNVHRFYPPEIFSFSSSYYLDVPTELKNNVSMNLFRSIVHNVAEIYDISFADLKHIIERDTGIMSFRFRSDDSLISNLRYPKFNTFHKHMTHLLNDSAIFSITGEFKFNRNKRVREVQQYLNECSFLQTEVGSFVVRIELPTETYLIENDWEKETLKSDHINLILVDSFKLAADIAKIDPTDDEAYTVLINKQKDLLCKNVLDDIKGMYHETDNPPTEVVYNDVNVNSNVALDNNVSNNIQRIDVFTSMIQDRMKSEEEILVDIPRGTIIALKSKDPDSNTNSIVITGYNSTLGVMQYVKLHVESSDYKTACYAHAHKKSVCLNGVGRSSIKQITLMSPYRFSVNE